jgi:mRNA-degrading endonuclease RelE of RelBE toxin-antitoxin system
MPDRYALRYSIEFDRDLDTISAYDGPIIRAAIEVLRDQAEQTTRHRRPLRRQVSWCPDATWQLRIGAYRIFYSVREGTVSLLRVTLKERRTTEEMGR